MSAAPWPGSTVLYHRHHDVAFVEGRGREPASNTFSMTVRVAPSAKCELSEGADAQSTSLVELEGGGRQREWRYPWPKAADSGRRSRESASAAPRRARRIAFALQLAGAPPRRRRCQQLARRGAAARGRRLIGCRRTCWASCSTSYRSPTTSLQWRRRAVLCDAASSREKAAARPRSRTLAGHDLRGLAVAPTAVITGSYDNTVKVWRDGTCERTIQAP